MTTEPNTAEEIAELSKKRAGKYEQDTLEGFNATEVELARNAYRDGFEDGVEAKTAQALDRLKEKVKKLNEYRLYDGNKWMYGVKKKDVLQLIEEISDEVY